MLAMCVFINSTGFLTPLNALVVIIINHIHICSQQFLKFQMDYLDDEMDSISLKEGTVKSKSFNSSFQGQ